MNINEFVSKIIIQMYDKEEETVIDAILKDFHEHKEKYADIDNLIFIDRDKVKKALKIGLEALKQEKE